MSNAWSFETRQIHAGQTPDSQTGARALPIYQTTSYVFDSADQAADRFALAELGPIYTRITNPTTETVENRIADLEGGVGALLVASGSSAITLAVLNLAGAGDHVVSSPSLYGGTQNLFAHTLPRLGIEVTFVDDPADPASWRAATRPNTKAFFGETIANPSSDVLDIRAVADEAHAAGVPLIVDNTVATPYLSRPIEHGADVVVHSATKYLGGHGTAIAGAIVDAGRFDYGAEAGRFPGFTEPDPSYNGLVYAEALGEGGLLGANVSYIIKARVQLLRDRHRFANGVCPCCTRSFDNVRRHIASQHPGYDPGPVASKAPTYRCSCGYRAGSFRGLRIHQGMSRADGWARVKSLYSAHLTEV